MRFPWSLSPKVLELQREIEEIGRTIEATRPIVEEAVKRTNASFIAVEKETRRVSLALISDLDQGWSGGRG